MKPDLLIVGSALTVAAHYVPWWRRFAAAPLMSKMTNRFRSKRLGVDHGHCARVIKGRSGVDFDAANLDLTEMRSNRSLWRSRPRMKSAKCRRRNIRSRWRKAVRRRSHGSARRPVGAHRSAAGLSRECLQRIEFASTMRDLRRRNQTDCDLPKDQTTFHSDKTIAPELVTQYRTAVVAALEFVLHDESSKKNDADPSLLKRVADIHQIDCENSADLGAVRDLVREFAGRAFRRPVRATETDEFVARFVAGMKEGKTVDESIKVVLTELLTSLDFLFRRFPPSSDDSTGAEFRLASRLSFFLCRSTPDRELMTLAKNGQLERQLDRQVERLLRDVRSQAFVRQLARSWLSLDKLDQLAQLDPGLRPAMRQETELFLDAILREERSVLELLDADFTFLNDRLAHHYGIANVDGSAMRRVALTTRQRGGLLTHGSVLALTSGSDAACCRCPRQMGARRFARRRTD